MLLDMKRILSEGWFRLTLACVSFLTQLPHPSCEVLKTWNIKDAMWRSKGQAIGPSRQLH